MSVKELLEDILEIKWAAQPSLSEQYGYHFIISADDKDRILGNINQAIIKLGLDKCVVCHEGVEALRQKLIEGDYNELEDLQLCNACRSVLLKSVDTAIEEGKGHVKQEQES